MNVLGRRKKCKKRKSRRSQKAINSNIPYYQNCLQTTCSILSRSKWTVSTKIGGAKRNYHNLLVWKLSIIQILIQMIKKYIRLIGRHNNQAFESLKLCYFISLFYCPTVGENIIATTKIRNNYVAIQSFKHTILRQQYWTFLYCSL